MATRLAAAGAVGPGRYELALSLAAAWLCEAPDAVRGACGQCASCHAIAVRTHADLCVLLPENRCWRGWPLPDKAQADIDDKNAQLGNPRKLMRDAIEFSQRTSARGRGKAVLVYPAST